MWMFNAKKYDGSTALMRACSSGISDRSYRYRYHNREEVVRLSLKHDDIDINEKDDGGKTALMVASNRGHVRIVRG